MDAVFPKGPLLFNREPMKLVGNIVYSCIWLTVKADSPLVDNSIDFWNLLSVYTDSYWNGLTFA